MDTNAQKKHTHFYIILLPKPLKATMWKLISISKELRFIVATFSLHLFLSPTYTHIHTRTHTYTPTDTQFRPLQSYLSPISSDFGSFVFAIYGATNKSLRVRCVFTLLQHHKGQRWIKAAAFFSFSRFFSLSPPFCRLLWALCVFVNINNSLLSGPQYWEAQFWLFHFFTMKCIQQVNQQRFNSAPVPVGLFLALCAHWYV